LDHAPAAFRGCHGKNRSRETSSQKPRQKTRKE